MTRQSLYDYGYGNSYDYSANPYDYYNYSPYNYDDQSGYAGSSQSTGNATVSTVQLELSKLGYYNGEIDGTLGDQTEAALARYQQDRESALRGRLTLTRFNRWESNDERIQPLLCEESGTNGGGHRARCSRQVRLP